jgi:ATP adenylyltransferase
VQILFTPWRYDYLTSPKREQDCIFCAAARSDDLKGTLTLYRDDRVLAMLNRYPYTNGHVMVAPIQHKARLYETDEPVLTALIRVTAEAQRILSNTYHPDGFNIGMNFGQVAGAGIADHYHVHIVPRWGGDSNFMTVTARTRMVPEELETTFAKLQPQFNTVAKAASR